MKELVVVDTKSPFRHSPVQIARMSVNGEPLADSYQLRTDTTIAKNWSWIWFLFFGLVGVGASSPT